MGQPFPANAQAIAALLQSMVRPPPLAPSLPSPRSAPLFPYRRALPPVPRPLLAPSPQHSLCGPPLALAPGRGTVRAPRGGPAARFPPPARCASLLSLLLLSLPRWRGGSISSSRSRLPRSHTHSQSRTSWKSPRTWPSTPAAAGTSPAPTCGWHCSHARGEPSPPRPPEKSGPSSRPRATPGRCPRPAAVRQRGGR